MGIDWITISIGNDHRAQPSAICMRRTTKSFIRTSFIKRLLLYPYPSFPPFAFFFVSLCVSLHHVSLPLSLTQCVPLNLVRLYYMRKHRRRSTLDASTLSTWFGNSEHGVIFQLRIAIRCLDSTACAWAFHWRLSKLSVQCFVCRLSSCSFNIFGLAYNIIILG